MMHRLILLVIFGLPFSACKSRAREAGKSSLTGVSAGQSLSPGLPVLAALSQESPTTMLQALRRLNQETNDWDRIVIANSRSLQSGTRVILSSEKLQTNVSFTLDPTQIGFSSMEIKAFDQSKAAWEFVEVSFADDLQHSSDAEKKRLAEVVFPASGVYFNFDGLNNGENRCRTCHEGGDSRFDMRELPGVIGPGRLFEANAGIARERFDQFTSADSSQRADEQRLLTDADSQQLKVFWLQEAKKIATRLARLDAQSLGERLYARLKGNKPKAAGVLAILNGAYFPDRFTDRDAKELFNFVGNHEVTHYRKLIEDLPSPTPAAILTLSSRLASLFGTLRTSEYKSRQRDANANGLPVEFVEPQGTAEVFSRLTLYLDQSLHKLDWEKNDTRENLDVKQWGPTASHTGPWFNYGDQTTYLESIKQAMLKVLRGSASTQ